MADSPSNPNALSPREDRRKKARIGWVGWLGWVIAALAIAAAIYFVLNSQALQQTVDANSVTISQLRSQTARSQKLMDALTSPDSNRLVLTESRGPARPAGHVTYLPQSGALIFVASDLHRLPQSKIYELWLFPSNGTAPVSAGVFRPAGNGSASVVLPSIPEGIAARSFAVTVEEAQGSQTPSLPFVMSGH